MNSRFSELIVGKPLKNKAAQVFPLFGANGQNADYVLASHAIAKNLAEVHETSKAGTVSALIVENKSDKKILFIEGEHLIGAKQNRISTLR